ncbi:chemotaxis protein MotB [Paracoccus suum]|uniref:Chemotaxis protein MotB n=1 Tax=Paracoccus suum TaxID=2259340 RepID=A0A344PNU2_9RHOB|nr:flagellar motor protein MotB [Paracoccus suum]AXC51047.1 chemotaxis protein MotB [Paracoccus suum]
MTTPANRNAAPIIIRRMAGSEHAAHHGGAWKVAYADFVTAMMAFFLLMWLLNATTEKQRAGLADYFNPTVVQSKSGGTMAFEGTDTATEAGKPLAPPGFDELARDIATQLSGNGAESMQQRNLLRHVVTRVTDEGLVIELSDLAGEPLFQADTAQPTRVMEELSAIVARVLAHVRNEVAFAGHVHAFPETLIHSPVWSLSESRAQTARRLIEAAGLGARRTARVTAFGDRRARSSNPMDPANNRVELILLR